jgi:serine/threonine-protein kinase
VPRELTREDQVPRESTREDPVARELTREADLLRESAAFEPLVAAMSSKPAREARDPLEAGLAIGFRLERATVLDAIERLTGAEAPRVKLEDDRVEPNAPAISAIHGRGNYAVQGEIARGGMGVILRCRDADLGRDVAIKVLRDDLARNPDVLRRFVEEAQIGGQLQHPGIVPVYELGLMADQRPFFAMKLVEGRTLAAALADGSERGPLLSVFDAVCQTMAYAHSRGVVHRDLKPANVLIGEFGEVQVVDWGLAKVLRAGASSGDERDEAAVVRTTSVVRTALDTGDSNSIAGRVMGTPAYMPPEQARGEVGQLDERTDVFALGAILCELLTGAPPYRGGGEKTVRQAAEARLEDATARLAACDADRELIELCTQCLAARPADRPRSALVLAERVHGYLVSVEARARAAQIHAAEAKVRARATAWLAAAGFVLATAGTGTWLWLRDQRAQRTRANETAVTTAMQDAKLARGQRDWPAATAALERGRARIDGGPASDGLRVEFASLSASIESEAEEARRAARLAEDNAALLAALQDVRLPEGDQIYPTNWKEIDRRYGEIAAAHGLRVDDGEIGELARALAGRGISIELASELDEWASVRRRALDEIGAARLAQLAGDLDDDPTRGRVRAALASKDLERLKSIAADPSALELPAATQRLLAHSLVLGKLHGDAIALLYSARRRHPQDFLLGIELARALRHTHPSQPAEAAAQYEAAVAMRPSSVEAWHEFGQTLINDLHDPQRALELFEAAVRRSPGDGHMHFHLANVLTTLKRDDQAIASYRRSLELEPDYAIAWCDLGVSLDRTGAVEEAIASYDRAIELDPSSPHAHFDRGISLEKLARHEDAIASLRRALELDPSSAGTQFRLGYSQFTSQEYDDAIASYRRALELDPAYTVTHYYLALALERVGRIREAIDAYADAARANPSDRRSHTALTWLLATAESDELRDPARAVEHARKAVELAPDDAGQLELLGIALFVDNEYDEARDALERTLGIAGDEGGGLLFLALVQARLGESDEARITYSRAREHLDRISADLPMLRRFVELARREFDDEDEH